MSVYELIRLLEKHPPDLRVVVNGYEEGYDDLSPDAASLRGRDSLEHRKAPNGKGSTVTRTVCPEAPPAMPRWSQPWSCGECRIEKDDVG